MARIREKETGDLCQRFQALEILLPLLKGVLGAFERLDTACKDVWKFMNSKYEPMTTEELVSEIKKDFFGELGTKEIPEEDKNIAQFLSAAIIMFELMQKLDFLSDVNRKTTVPVAVKKLKLERNRILKELKRRKVPQVATQKMIEI